MVQIIRARCSAVLGFDPELIVPEPGATESTLALDFRIDKLLATGYALSGNAQAEIDATLLLCQSAFGKSS
jgi:hypothetical protein